MDGAEALSLLVAGPRLGSAGRLEQSLDHMSNQLEHLVRELLALGSRSRPDRALYGPFLARSALELGCSAMVGRIDPMRVLFVIGLQESSDYDCEKAYSMSIHWTGDVVSKDKPRPMWSEAHKPQEMTRALFGDYTEHLVWKEAFERVDQSKCTGPIFSQLTRIPTDGFVNNMRTKATLLYSAFSKGVHHENFVPALSMFDASTLSTRVTELIALLAHAGLVLSQCGTALRKPSDACVAMAMQAVDAIEVRYE